MNIINLKDTSNKLFYIGGVVRDFLLKRESLDIDITYVGNAIEYCSKFGEVIRTNPEFGTVRVRVGKKEIDFASTRTETYPQKGHLPVVEKLGVPLKDDVMRRDFTINALAISVTTGEIVDYTGGLEDLKHKKLRIIHDKSFIDDPTRIIRALKFSMRFGFELEEHSLKLQNEYLKNINYDISYKRLKKELVETFGISPNAAPALSIPEGALQNTYQNFINNGIYKLVTPNKVKLPEINIEELIQKYPIKHQWLIFAGTLGDLSRLPLTKTEQKILNDIPQKIFRSDFEIYKAFENLHTESILLYAILHDSKAALRYLETLRNIKISINGRSLKSLGLTPSPKFSECFDFLLKHKLKNPNLSYSQELELCKEFFSNHL